VFVFLLKKHYFFIFKNSSEILVHADIVIVFISFYFVPFRSVLPSLSLSFTTPQVLFCTIYAALFLFLFYFLSFLNLTFAAASIYTLPDHQQTGAQPL